MNIKLDNRTALDDGGLVKSGATRICPEFSTSFASTSFASTPFASTRISVALSGSL